jgi:hypothetical protein
MRDKVGGMRDKDQERGKGKKQGEGGGGTESVKSKISSSCRKIWSGTSATQNKP